MSDPRNLAAVRGRMKHAWRPFFAKFGNLTSVQLQAIPRILEGAKVVLASPTASGKTEAAVAPVAEKFILEQWQGLSLLYVVPTRALANDSLVRIEGPLQDMGIRAALKHGDRPHLPGNKLPNCLITTPESLDSLICRRSQAFVDLRTVILDEIHLVDNTYRGDQLRLLLWRLRKLSSHTPLAIHVLSATLSAPHEIGRRYINDFDMVTVAGVREIDYDISGSLEQTYRKARSQGWKKLLCFCNLRESVESVAAELGKLWSPYPVVAHHGSLNRREREEAEMVMREARVAVCVATSTLEIGIDIGDIDLIVLAEVPWSVSSLVQRLGRGNRRDSVIHAAAIANSTGERLLLEAMFETARVGALPQEFYEPDLSVAVQQTFSHLFQHPEGAPEGQLTELLSCLCSGDEATAILGELRDDGWLEWRTGRWCASTKVMDLAEKGKIHSNIPDSEGHEVVDVESGKKIGTIAGFFDDVFVLARRAWRVVSVTGKTVKVRPFKGKAGPALFRRRRAPGAFHRFLPPDLKIPVKRL